MQIGIDLGLHRRTPVMNQHNIKNELRKRLFWSCYNLDRQVSIPLGRPVSASRSNFEIVSNGLCSFQFVIEILMYQ